MRNEVSGSLVVRWCVYLLIAGTACAITVGTYDSTFSKPYVLRILSAAVVVCWLVASAFREKAAFTPFHLGITVFFLASAASLPGAMSLGLSIARLSELSCFMAVAVVVAWEFRDKDVQQLEMVFFIVTAAACLFGMMQAVPGMLPFATMQSGHGQITSTFGNTTYFAGFLVMMLPLALARSLREQSRGVQVFTGILSIAILVELIMTGTRSAWAGVCGAVAIVAFRNLRSGKTRTILLIFAAASLVAAAIFSGPIWDRLVHSAGATSSFARRGYFYEGAWRAFLASPLRGQGVGNFIEFLPKFRSPDYWIARGEDIVPHAHNEFLEILSESGIPGLLAFIFVLVIVIRQLSLRGSDLFAGCAAGIAGALIDNLASMNLRVVPNALVFWILLSLPFTESLRTARKIPAPRFVGILSIVGFILLVSYEIPLFTKEARAEKAFMEAMALRWNNRESAEKFLDVLRDQPSNEEARLYLAADYVQRSEFGRARDHTDTLLQGFHYYPKARILSAIARLELGDTLAALHEISDELLIENSPQALYFAADLSGRAALREKEHEYSRLLLESSIRGGAGDYVVEGLKHLARTRANGTDRDLLSRVGEKFGRDPKIREQLSRMEASP